MSDPWDQLPDWTAAAPLVGPFPYRPFLDTWWAHRGRGEPMVISGGGAALPLYVHEGFSRVAGEADLTDYHSPLGEGEIGGGLIDDALARTAPGTRIAWDSLPIEVARPMAHLFRERGLIVTCEQHEVAAVLDLPDDHDEWIAGLSKKERHETRRKSRRFEAELGPPRLRDTDDVERFAALHRTAPGEKGGFMTDGMERFFGELLGAGRLLALTSQRSDEPVAMAFCFEDVDALYLYNSAFDPDMRALSPGVVLISELVRRSITLGHTVFDFLKGDESYKFRLGARPRPLYTLEGVVPS